MKLILKLFWLRIKHPKANIFISEMPHYKSRLMRIKDVWYNESRKYITIDLK